MQRLTIALSLALLTAAGGCKGDSRADASQAAMIAKLTAFKERMCACKDLPCARKISGEVTTYMRETGATKNTTKEVDAVGKELQRCAVAAFGKQRDLDAAAGPGPSTASDSDPLREPLEQAGRELLKAKTDDERIAAQEKLEKLRAERLERGDYHKVLIAELEKALARADHKIEDAKSSLASSTDATEREHLQRRLTGDLAERDFLVKRLAEVKFERAALRAGTPDAAH